MVAEVANGKPMDKYFKEQIANIRKTASLVFEQDSATGQIKWEDGPIDPKTNKPKKVPVLKKDLPVTAIPHVIDTCFDQCKKIGEAQGKLIEATKAWFHEALLGSGKFHGDTHAGNLMVEGSNITFIDFGNLYELKSARQLLDKEGKAVIDKKTNQPVMVNERHELLRVIMGATFRDKTFVLRGLENLLSPAGKAALEANRDKVEAVLDSILAKGKFSYDVVYRLNAVVSELQKLGLELPPQINCFVQSMARLANTISEMNTIINQTRALIDTVDGYVRPGPAPQRDELDLLGIALDFRTSAEGQVRVDDDNETLSYHHPDGTPFQISAFLHHLGTEGFGGFSFEDAPFQTNGAYYNKVLARLTNAQDPAEEARKLTDSLPPAPISSTTRRTRATCSRSTRPSKRSRTPRRTLRRPPPSSRSPCSMAPSSIRSAWQCRPRKAWLWSCVSSKRPAKSSRSPSPARSWAFSRTTSTRFPTRLQIPLEGCLSTSSPYP